MRDDRPTADGDAHGLHLSDKHIVFVLMTATLVAVVVFLFGVFVGRGVRGVKGSVAVAGMAAPGDVVPDAAGGDAPPLEGAARDSAGATPPAPLTYAERLGKTPPAERLPQPPAGGRPEDAGPPDVPAEPVAAAPAGQPPAARTPAAPVEAAYTVQVAAVRRREEADAIVKRLKTKGYDAYVFLPEGDQLGVFRVRIGSFKDKRQADQLAERLLSVDKRYKPWVTR